VAQTQGAGHDAYASRKARPAPLWGPRSGADPDDAQEPSPASRKHPPMTFQTLLTKVHARIGGELFDEGPRLLVNYQNRYVKLEFAPGGDLQFEVN